MDIGYGVGVDVAKDCKHDFRGFYSDRYYTWTEGELEDCFKKIKEKYNYVPDSEDKKLLVDYALDIINVKKYIKQGFSNEEISNEIKLSVEDIRKIRYEEVTIHVYFREQVVVEVRLEKYIKLVLENKLNLTKEQLFHVTSPFLTLKDIEELEKLKIAPNSNNAIKRYAEDLMVDWLQPLYFYEYDCDPKIIDMEKVDIIRNIAYRHQIYMP